MGTEAWGVSAAVALICWAAGTAAAGASAWPTLEGQGQVILKLETERATLALDDRGLAFPIPHQTTTALDLYGDYGLTRDLSLQFVAGLEHTRLGSREADRVGGFGAGLRYGLAHLSGGHVSAYAGVTAAAAREGRRPDIAVGPAGGELRILAGQSLRPFGHELFAEVQAARLFGAGPARQVRIDSTLGVQIRPRLLALTQVYSGRQEGRPSGASWVKLDQSLVRSIGAWRVQVGWRHLLAGRNIAASSGPLIGVWRSF